MFSLVWDLISFVHCSVYMFFKLISNVFSLNFGLFECVFSVFVGLWLRLVNCVGIRIRLSHPGHFDCVLVVHQTDAT